MKYANKNEQNEKLRLRLHGERFASYHNRILLWMEVGLQECMGNLEQNTKE